MLTHIDGSRLLQGMKSVRLVVRTEHEARLQVTSVEYRPQYQSVTYETTVTVPATGDWRPIYFPTRRSGSPGSRDENNRFDTAQVWIIRIADLAAPEPPRENVLEIAELAILRGH